MTDDFAILANGDGMVQVDLSLGNIVRLDFFGERKTFSPLHKAHWAGRPLPDGGQNMPPIERQLAGDFLCAPFGAYATPDLPFHGPTANSRWNTVENGRKIKMRLETTVNGATVEKEIALGSGPFLYQVNRFSGGQGTLPVSTHPMFDMKPGDRIFLSPKQSIKTPGAPMTADRHRLQYPASSDAFGSFPGSDGPVDLSRYPAQPGADDFVQLAEDPGSRLGWTALVSDDTVSVILKDPKNLPITQLWFSNGGRTEAPWSGKHKNVLGVEDACVPYDENFPTGIDLDPARSSEIRHVIGSFPRPHTWNEIIAIKVTDAALQITGDDGESMELPFNSKFFT